MRTRSATTRGEQRRAERPAPWWHGLVIAAVAVAAYLPALRNGYALDDSLIVSSRAARETAPLSTLFDASYFTLYNQDTYRPTATLTTMLSHRVGVDPRHAGHVQGILWHAGSAVLVRSLALCFLPAAPAIFAGLVFAVHPVATESTVSIGYREDAIVACLATGSLVLALRGGSRRRALALVAYALALFAKENALVTPVLLVLARLTLRRGEPLDRRALARELAAFGLVTAGYLVVRFGLMASPAPFAGDGAGGTYGDTLVAVPRIFAHYWRLLVVPWPQLVMYDRMFPVGASWLLQLPWLALDVAFMIGCVWLARTRPALGFGLLWFTVALTPALHVVPLRILAADRFMHLSLVGGAIAAGAVLAMGVAAAARPSVRQAAWASGGAALVALLVLTERRIPVWHDDFTLWSDTLRHNPHAYMGHFALSNQYLGRGDHERARRELEVAVADCPSNDRFGRERFCSLYAAALGLAWLEIHDLPRARAAFLQSLGFANGCVPAIVGLGIVRLEEGDPAGARAYADLATSLHPRDAVSRSLVEGLRVGLDYDDQLRRASERERSEPAQ